MELADSVFGDILPPRLVMHSLTGAITNPLVMLSGMENYVFMRPDPHEKALSSDFFEWESADGSRVRTFRLPRCYNIGIGSLGILDELADEDESATGSYPKMAFYGDARSNIANSLILAARLTGMELVLCAPAEEQPEISLYQGYSNISWEPDPMKAARDVDYFYTDVWVSMGFEEERERRMKLFIPYQVNEKLFTVAKPDAKFLHCLPAHRGEEVSAGVMDDPKRSIVFDEAENRLHVQKAVMSLLMK